MLLFDDADLHLILTVLFAHFAFLPLSNAYLRRCLNVTDAV